MAGRVGLYHQIIALADPVSALGDTASTWLVCVNAPAAIPVTMRMMAGSDQTNVGTLVDETTESVTLTTDADPTTWQILKGARFLPASTTHLELHLRVVQGRVARRSEAPSPTPGLYEAQTWTREIETLPLSALARKALALF